jgi:hypothetical protein
LQKNDFIEKFRKIEAKVSASKMEQTFLLQMNEAKVPAS